MEILEDKDNLNYCHRITAVSYSRKSDVVRAFAHGAMGRRIDPSWRTY